MSAVNLVCPECGSKDVMVKGDRCLCADCWHMFDYPVVADDDTEDTKSLKLFLSYGHEQEPIVKLIKERLEEHGHQVWLDASQIKAGDDWREAIAEGILSSNGVIACLSKHAGRPQGVCLDEIDIALNVKGGNILTVLLEPQEMASLPDSVSHIQVLDMSEWRERMDKGDDAFMPWFDEKMSELLQALESREVAEFDSEIEEIGNKLAIGARIDSSKQTYLLSQPFVGREWLCDLVAEWLDDPNTPRVCLVTGDAGLGKSAFAAHLSHWQWKIGGRVVASLFCDANQEALSDPCVIIRILAYMLACRIPQYRALLFEELRSAGNLSDMGEGDLFSCLIGEPLSHTISNNENMLVVIDGIDEAGSHDENPLADTLARYANRLPTWVKLLITSRRVSPATTPFGTGSYVLDLKGEADDNRKDMRAYLTQALARYEGDPAFEDAVDKIAESSGGVFLYATLMVDALAKGVANPEEIGAHCPDGLHEAFYQWFRWTFPNINEYRNSFRDALGCISVAPDGGLPIDEFEVLFEWDENQMNDFLRRIEVLIRHTKDFFGRPAITFDHAFISEWLNSDESGNYQCSAKAAYKKMGKAYYDIARNEGVSELSDYETLHVLDLLDLAGMKKESEELWADEGVPRRIFDMFVSLDTRDTRSRAATIARHLLSIAHSHGNGTNGFKGEMLLSTAMRFGCFARGDDEEKVQAFRDAIAVFNQLAEKEPVVYLPREVEARLGLSFYCGESGEHEEAEAQDKQAIKILLDLAKTDPVTYGTKAIETYEDLSNLYRHWRYGARMQDALQAILDAETLLNALIQTAPNSVAVAQARAKLLMGKGMLQTDIEHHREALESYFNGFQIYNMLAKIDPGSYFWLLRDAADKVSYAYERFGMTEESVELQEWLYGLASSYYRAKKISIGQLSQAIAGYGDTLKRCGKLDAAEEILRFRVKVERIIEESSGTSRFGSNIVEALAELGDVLAILGKNEEAEKVYKESAVIPIRWSEAEEHNLSLAVWRIEKLGAFLDSIGRHEEAQSYRQKAREIKRAKGEDFGWIIDPSLS